MKKFVLVSLISFVSLVVMLDGVIVDTNEGRRMFFVVLGSVEFAVLAATLIGILLEKEENPIQRAAVYGIASRFNGEYAIICDNSAAVALAQAESDDKAAVANAEAAAWRDLMVTHVVSAAGLLSLDYDLIRGLGLKLSVEYNAAGKPVVRVR